MKISDFLIDCIGHNDLELASSIYRFCHAILFFSRPANVQVKIIKDDGDCPLSFAWYDMYPEIESFELALNNRNLGLFYDKKLHLAVSELINHFDNLSKDECKEGSYDIFSLEGWETIRQCSSKVLELLEWDIINEWESDIFLI